ncbi:MULTISPECIES: RNA-guided endonuclease InsQ/TnpB family protein [unclassified Methanoculleus]|jgi:IS605 OrfB family transposase|uniref:Transposase n=1 Tax=Methanoculleus palmolei TaxID=72612 RepID=A0ABD8A716_9EURY|nr:transposase [Methanoculleus sp. UBA377]MDD2472778.1 transposase [Methanoculleus sp.]WOX54950.1 transposase [Methanoculleus palmolei]
MLVQKTVQMVIEPDRDLRETLDAFTEVCNRISPTAYNSGTPLNALRLHRAVYATTKGAVSSQLTCTAIRLTAGAYVAARKHGHPIHRPFHWKTPHALFLIGKRGRDASFRKDGTLSIWTVAGRKHLSYSVPEVFRETLASAVETDSVVVTVRGDRLIGHVAVTLEVPDMPGVVPVGVDLNETNAVVAVDADGRTLFITGLHRKVLNIRTRKTTSRLQVKLETKKAEGTNTRSVVRALKRLSLKRSRRTRDFCHCASKQLIEWAPQNCVLVFEDLSFSHERKTSKKRSKALNHRLSVWPRGMIRAFATYKVAGKGIIDGVDPAYTSQICSRCGLLGSRSRHSFSCPHCGHTDHSDINAAINIRNRFTALRDSGVPSTTPETS